jgi:uncharacterized membrane protein YeiH
MMLRILIEIVNAASLFTARNGSVLRSLMCNRILFVNDAQIYGVVEKVQ